MLFKRDKIEPGGNQFKPSDTGEQSARAAHIFQMLGTDTPQNITLILEQARLIIDGLFAFFIPICSQKGAPLIHTSPDLPQDIEIDSITDSTLFKNTDERDTHHVLSSIPPGDRQTDPLAKKLNIKSCIGTPVFFQQTPRGTLWVIDIRPRSFTQKDITCLETLAAALGLEEKRLSQGNKMLEAQTARVRELEKKLAQAREMELIGSIVGGVAHDLNNILAGLVSYPELLLLQMEKSSPLMEPISFIHDAGLKAADIVQDLLALTRRGIEPFSAINLNQAIQDYQNSPVHNRLVKNFPGIDFKIKSEPDLLNLNGSESHISKVIVNLVMNAAHAVQNNGQIMIETFNRYVDITLGGMNEMSEGEYVVLRVSDDGEGISQEDIKRIFEPFYAKKHMGRRGSGLCLSVVWTLVKDHGGHIEIFSTKEKGTFFELYFPGTRDKLTMKPEKHS